MNVRGHLKIVFRKIKIKKIKMFDENYFLYLEEIDLCKRLKLISEKIYICGKAKITHLSAKSSNIGFEFEKCRNWHWMWSKVYYDKKFYGKIYAFKKSFFHLLKNRLFFGDQPYREVQKNHLFPIIEF